jgi:hypothetical protein
VLLLSCGHVSLHLDEGVQASEADEWLWTCIECEAEEQEAIRVIAAMSNEVAKAMTEEEFESLVESAT